MEIVQLFGHEAVTERQFGQHNQRFRHAATRSNVYDSLMFALVDGVAAICVAVLLWFGSGLVTNLGFSLPFEVQMSAGLLVAFIEYLDRLFRPLRELSAKVTVLQRGAAALPRTGRVWNARTIRPCPARPRSSISPLPLLGETITSRSVEPRMIG